MSQEVADSVKGLPTIAINNTYQLAPWAAMLYAADAEWWGFHNPDFAGLKVSLMRVAGVKTLVNAGVVGYCDETDRIHTLGNSGAQALQIAVKAGAKRVLLCGYDMQGCHWHGKHPKPLRNTEPENYAQWCERYKELAKHLRTRCEVINCTEDSALTCFPKMSLDAALSLVGKEKRHCAHSA